MKTLAFPDGENPVIATALGPRDGFRESFEEGDVLAATLRRVEGEAVSGEAMSISPLAVVEPRVMSTVKTRLSWNEEVGSKIGAPLVEAANDRRSGAFVVFPSEMSAEPPPVKRALTALRSWALRALSGPMRR